MEETMKSTLNTKHHPPSAPRKEHVITLHGDSRTDSYYWMRDLKDPDVMKYIEEENAYTDEAMADSSGLQESLYQELVGRIRETDMSVPVKFGSCYYYSRTEKGRQYKIYCRKNGSLESAEEIILDLNVLAEGHEFCSLGAFEPSPDNEMLLYAIDFSGAEEYDLCIKDLARGTLCDTSITKVTGDSIWTGDGKTIFYTIYDPSKRPYKLYSHLLGSARDDDRLIFTEEDQAFALFVSKCRSQRFIFLTLRSNTTSEVHFLDASEPYGNFSLIAPRRHKIEYFVEHIDEHFYIRTNEKALNFRVMVTDVSDPSRKNWRDFIAHRPDVLLEDFDAFKNHLVLYERNDSIRKIRILQIRNGLEHYIDFPEAVHYVWASGNLEYDTALLRYTYESPVTPRSVYDYDMNEKTRVLKKQDEIKGYDLTQYEAKRLYAESYDGTKVPISLFYRKGTSCNGEHPLFLIGYGAYGICYDPAFSSHRLSLVDRGFIYAIAHIRGGKDGGMQWYLDGKLLKKKNSFRDFIACAEYLIQEKYTSRDKLIASGRSAGGLLMGAVTTMRPDLFKAVIAEVPFVDALNTMLDASLPLTVPEYEEWGNPQKISYYRYIRSYSPYDNTKAREYPHILIMASLNDTRVMFWEPLKWTARLRELKKDFNTILLKTNLGAGHSGASGRYDTIREIAFEYAFVLKVLGITGPARPPDPLPH